jgi:hypothetical protein
LASKTEGIKITLLISAWGSKAVVEEEMGEHQSSLRDS